MEQIEARDRRLEAALPHVPFDGWSEATFQAAIADSGQPEGLTRALFPRGGLDLARAYHALGDREMARRLRDEPLSTMRFRERVARAVMLRLELADRELVRRGSALFALPQNSAEGVKALWGTADVIWTALGDTSEDANWYTKRASLATVYGATVLFWLGDDDPALAPTRAFLDRRIEGIMQFESFKAALRRNTLGRLLTAGPDRLMAMVKPPRPADNLPGRNGPRPF